MLGTSSCLGHILRNIIIAHTIQSGKLLQNLLNHTLLALR